MRVKRGAAFLLLMVVACLATLSMPVIGESYEKVEVWNIGPAKASVIYNNGQPVFLTDTYKDSGRQYLNYPGTQFEVAGVVFDGNMTEINWMEADKPIQVSPIVDATEWARQKGVKGNLTNETIYISGIMGALVSGDNLYIAVLPIGDTAKMTVTHVGYRSDTQEILEKIAIQI